MAKTISRFTCQLLLKCTNLSGLQRLPAVSYPSYVRCYSQYPTSYQNPIIPRGDKDTILESEAFKQVEYLPVRAALNYYSNSMFLDPLIMQFTNHVMLHGRKLVARRIIGDAFVRIKRIQLEKYHKAPPEERDKIELDPVKIFHKAIANARPYLTLTRLRLGAVWYQVPRPITDKRATSTAMKWFVEICNDKPQTVKFHTTLAQELIGASEYTGRVIQKKIELHKQCEANKAYAHFRWG